MPWKPGGTMGEPVERAAYDLIVIGAGPAGEKGVAQAAYFDKRVALVEESPSYGGSVANTGVPGKAMRETALYLSGFGQRALHGLTLTYDGTLNSREFSIAITAWSAKVCSSSISLSEKGSSLTRPIAPIDAPSRSIETKTRLRYPIVRASSCAWGKRSSFSMSGTWMIPRPGGWPRG